MAYPNIVEIFSSVDGVILSRYSGSQFVFPLLVTEKMRNTEIDVLDLSVRSYNCLKRAGIYTLDDFNQRIKSTADLRSIRNCGKKSIEEIMDHVFKYQYDSLNADQQKWYLQKVIEMNKNTRA